MAGRGGRARRPVGGRNEGGDFVPAMDLFKSFTPGYWYSRNEGGDFVPAMELAPHVAAY